MVTFTSNETLLRRDPIWAILCAAHRGIARLREPRGVWKQVLQALLGCCEPCTAKSGLGFDRP